MQYIKAIFKFKSIEDYQQDLLISDLADLGFDTFEDSEAGFTAFVIKENFIEQDLKSLLNNYTEDFEAEYILEDVADENWNAEWEKNFSPLIIDDVCYESTIENANLNQVTNLVALCGSKEVIPDDSYDIILANINRNILLDQIGRYAEVLKPQGKIFFSGFYLDPDLSMITAECAKYGI
ncbi:MAG: 50S ribosomal protein L11 methyltransferase, partial [Pedobacter sp.]